MDEDRFGHITQQHPDRDNEGKEMTGFTREGYTFCNEKEVKRVNPTTGMITSYTPARGEVLVEKINGKQHHPSRNPFIALNDSRTKKLLDKYWRKSPSSQEVAPRPAFAKISAGQARIILMKALERSFKKIREQNLTFRLTENDEVNIMNTIQHVPQKEYGVAQHIASSPSWCCAPWCCGSKDAALSAVEDEGK
jgi:hypothetical protein